jgi:hypothetical protein
VGSIGTFNGFNAGLDAGFDQQPGSAYSTTLGVYGSVVGYGAAIEVDSSSGTITGGAGKVSGYGPSGAVGISINSETGQIGKSGWAGVSLPPIAGVTFGVFKDLINGAYFGTIGFGFGRYAEGGVIIALTPIGTPSSFGRRGDSPADDERRDPANFGSTTDSSNNGWGADGWGGDKDTSPANFGGTTDSKNNGWGDPGTGWGGDKDTSKASPTSSPAPTTDPFAGSEHHANVDPDPDGFGLNGEALGSTQAALDAARSLSEQAALDALADAFGPGTPTASTPRGDRTDAVDNIVVDAQMADAEMDDAVAETLGISPDALADIGWSGGLADQDGHGDPTDTDRDDNTNSDFSDNGAGAGYGGDSWGGGDWDGGDDSGDDEPIILDLDAARRMRVGIRSASKRATAIATAPHWRAPATAQTAALRFRGHSDNMQFSRVLVKNS